MGLTLDIRNALDTRMTSATTGLGVTVSKAWPSYDRPDVSFPTAFVMWQDDTMLETSGRTGGGSKWRTSFAARLFCRDEAQLMTYVDSVRTMFDGWKTATISGYDMRIRANQIERLANEAETPEALRYVAQWTILFEYVR